MYIARKHSTPNQHIKIKYQKDPLPMCEEPFLNTQTMLKHWLEDSTIKIEVKRCNKNSIPPFGTMWAL